MDNSGSGEAMVIAKDLDEKIEESDRPKSEGRLGAANVPSSPSSSSGDGGDDHLRKLDSKIVKLRDSLEGEAAYAHLPDNEREIVKRQLDVPTVKVTFVTLFRYATRNDLIFLAISAFCACAGGAVMPLMTVSEPYDAHRRNPLRYSILTFEPAHLRKSRGHVPRVLSGHCQP